MSEKIEDMLDDRQMSYGKFSDGVHTITKILTELDKYHYQKTNGTLTTEETVILVHILIKLTRIAATPNHVDSWSDMEGYSKLIKEFYSGESDA